MNIFPIFKNTTIHKCYLRKTVFGATTLAILGGQVTWLSALTPAALRARALLRAPGGEDEAVISHPAAVSGSLCLTQNGGSSGAENKSRS